MKLFSKKEKAISKSDLFNEIIYALGVLSTNLIIHSKFRVDRKNTEFNEHVLYNNQLEAVRIIQELINTRYSVDELTNIMKKAKIYPEKWKNKAIELNESYKTFFVKIGEPTENLDPQYYS